MHSFIEDTIHSQSNFSVFYNFLDRNPISDYWFEKDTTKMFWKCRKQPSPNQKRGPNRAVHVNFSSNESRKMTLAARKKIYHEHFCSTTVSYESLPIIPHFPLVGHTTNSARPMHILEFNHGYCEWCTLCVFQSWRVLCHRLCLPQSTNSWISAVWKKCFESASRASNSKFIGKMSFEMSSIPLAGWFYSYAGSVPVIRLPFHGNNGLLLQNCIFGFPSESNHDSLWEINLLLQPWLFTHDKNFSHYQCE